MYKTSENRLHHFLTEEVTRQHDLCIALDAHLNFIAANDTACSHFNKSEYELVGRCILDLFPALIASKNHRNFLRALAGQIIENDHVVSMSGDRFNANYEPLVLNDEVKAVLVTAKPAAF